MVDQHVRGVVGIQRERKGKLTITRYARALVLGCAAVVVVLVVSACSSQDLGPGKSPAARPLLFSVTSVSGTLSTDLIVLHYAGDSCVPSVAASAVETPESVTLRVEAMRTAPADADCLGVGTMGTVEVTLESPIGDRVLIDAATGAAVPIDG